MKKREILHLVLTRKWFKMILDGIKKEEYRDLTEFWKKRLIGFEFEYIVFRNGYSKTAPEIKIRCLGIDIKTGLAAWGAVSGTKYITLSLGEIMETKNLTDADQLQRLSA